MTGSNQFVRRVAAVMIGIGLMVASARAAAPSGYVLNWSDEFNGTSIDTSKWRVPSGEDHWGNPGSYGTQTS